MRKLQIVAKTAATLQKVTAFLTERNKGPVFIPWATSTPPGFVDATPDTIEHERALYRELKAAGFSVYVILPSDNAANLASIRAAIARGAKPVLGFGDFGIPAEK